MQYNNPISSQFKESCQKVIWIDQSQFHLPIPSFVQDWTNATNPSFVTCVEPSGSSSLTSATEWRLTQDLRAFAQPPAGPPPVAWDVRTPLATLVKAAAVIATGHSSSDTQRGLAIADFAVSGRLAYDALVAEAKALPTSGALAEALMPRLRTLAPGVGADVLMSAASQVASRVQSVAWAIRGDPASRASLRPKLGWIAVSGEDDTPHRPCNVPSLLAPQFDLAVTVKDLTVKTRFAIVQGGLPPAPNPVPPTQLLPSDEAPVIPPDVDFVFLFIHGLDSRLEEAADLIPMLFQAARERGRSISIVTLDLPGFGYSSRRVVRANGTSTPFDQSLFPTEHYPADSPALQFIEDYIVAFVETLDAITPFKEKVIPIGGSLGGNMGFRLGRRRTGIQGMRAICSWSPASVWESMTQKGWPGRYAIGQCTPYITAPEDPTQRKQYFYHTFDEPIKFEGITVDPEPEAYHSYGPKWVPCRSLYVCQSRLDRREIYNEGFRRWRWRIAEDQLVYSHQDPDPATGGTLRYLLNTVPMFLASGADDSDLLLNYYGNTQNLAQRMVNTPGTSLFLEDTGHSIHNERPLQLAESIFDFLTVFVDNKDNKDNTKEKDHKDNKDDKDDTKDRDKTPKDHETNISALPLLGNQPAQGTDAPEGKMGQPSQHLAAGQAFIRPEERPPVGEQALNQV